VRLPADGWPCSFVVNFGNLAPLPAGYQVEWWECDEHYHWTGPEEEASCCSCDRFDVRASAFKHARENDRLPTHGPSPSPPCDCYDCSDCEVGDAGLCVWDPNERRVWRCRPDEWETCPGVPVKLWQELFGRT
jgi:hypothetical protein